MKDELCSLCVMRGEGQPKGDPSRPSTRGVELGLGAHFSAASLLLPCCFLVSCIGCGNLSAGRAYRRGDRLLVAPWRQAWSQAGWPGPCVALVEMVEPWGLGLSVPSCSRAALQPLPPLWAQWAGRCSAAPELHFVVSGGGRAALALWLHPVFFAFASSVINASS